MSPTKLVLAHKAVALKLISNKINYKKLGLKLTILMRSRNRIIVYYIQDLKSKCVTI